MSIVRQLVQAHGRRVTADSEGEGRGSTFIVRRPVATAHAAVPSTIASDPAASIGGLSVLVVDDDDGSRAVV